MNLPKQIMLVVLTILSIQTNAGIKIGTFFIPGYIDSEKAGLFVELNKLIFSRLNEQFELVVEPVQNARISFLTNKTDVIFPELHESVAKYLPADDFVITEPFWKKRILLYQLKSSAFTSLEELYDKPVGAVKGYSYGVKITKNPSLEIQYTDNDILNIKMLLAGKFVAVFGDDSSTANAVKMAGAQNLVYSTPLPTGALDVFYACHNDTKGIRLCSQLSKIIRQLKADGIIDITSNIPRLQFKK